MTWASSPYNINDEGITRLAENVAFLVFDIPEGVIDIVAMRDKGNQAFEQSISPTMTHELVVVPGRDVGSLVLSQIDRLHLFWSDKKIYQIKHAPNLSFCNRY